MSDYVFLISSVTCDLCYFFFFKQKTAYEVRISDWSSDVCSSDLLALFLAVLWTVVATREYSPEQMAAFEPPAAADAPAVRPLASRGYAARAGWVAAGLAVALVPMRFALLREVLLLGALLAGYGIASASADRKSAG